MAYHSVVKLPKQEKKKAATSKNKSQWYGKKMEKRAAYCSLW